MGIRVTKSTDGSITFDADTPEEAARAMQEFEKQESAPAREVPARKRFGNFVVPPDRHITGFDKLKDQI